MVTTHLRARVAQAGALLAVVVGGIAVAPAVALASPPAVQITSLETEVLSGGRLNLKYEVADTNDNEGRATAGIRVSGMDCDGECGGIEQVNSDGREFEARLTAPRVDDGEQRQVQIRITALINGESASAEQTVTVKGADKPETVRRISGRVRDDDGEALAGAKVGLQDSAGNTYDTTSDGSGGYSFAGSEDDPIAPGSVTIAAGKDGFDTATVRVQATAGRNVTVPLTLKSKVKPTESPSPSPSASPSASAEASAEAAEPTPAEEATTEATDQVAAPASDEGGASWLFIIIGVLLVAAGIGAIVLVWLRRKNGAGPGDDDDPTGLSGSGGVIPPSQGRFHDATRVGAPIGGRATDATMVAPLSGGPSMADAPTVLQRPVPAADDEFPDPYGVPMPPPGGFAGTPAGGWEDDPAGGYGGGSGTQQYGGATGYGEPTQYGRPPQDGTYGGAPAGGPRGGGNAYGDGTQAGGYQAYSEPTGVYRPEADHDDGYGGGAYPAPAEQQGGYDRRGAAYPTGGYGQGPADQAGYDSWNGADDNGYAAPPRPGGNYGGGTYGGAQQYGGGYDDQGGYDQRGGYEGYQPDQQPPQQQGGAYGRPAGHDEYEDQAGYDQRGPRGQAPGQRRPADWHNG